MKNLVIIIFLFSLLLQAKYTYGQSPKSTEDSIIIALQKTKSDSVKIKLLDVLSNHLLMTSDFEGAMKYANEGLLVSEKAGSKNGLSEAYNKIGLIYTELGNYPAALKNNLNSLKICEEMGDKLGMANSYGNIGNIYQRQGNQPEALKNYTMALNLGKQLNIKNVVTLCLNNIGNVYLIQNNYPEALKNYNASLKLAQETNNEQGIILSCDNIGNVYTRQENYEEAQKYYILSTNEEKKIGDKRDLANSYMNIAELNIKLKKYPAAFDFLGKGLVLSREMGSKSQLVNGYELMSNLDSLTGNFKEAYQYSQLYSKMKDSLLNEASGKEVAQLKIQYESDKKDQQIKTQALQNRVLQVILYFGIAISLLIIITILMFFYLRNRRKKREYDHMLTDLELTILKAQLNPHFISNSLSAIKSFIEQQPQRASQYLSKIARLMRRVLEQNEQAFISLEEELQTVELYMQIEVLRLEYGFDFSFNLDSSVNPKLIMVPPLILQPIVENAIWHGLASKNERGAIVISAKLEEGLLKFAIEDNGAGHFPAEQRENINPHERKSYGLSITRKRIEILSKELKKKGYLNLEFQEGKTVAEIALPVNYH